MRFNVNDDQANLAFLRSQTAHIEAGVYAYRYPDIQYPELLPVDTSAPEFAQSVIYMSSDVRGAAAWINGNADDVPNVSTMLKEATAPVHTAGIGYDYGFEELGLARMLGYNLQGDKAQAAKRISEEFIEQKALTVGDTLKGFQPFINNSAVTPANVAQNAGATSRLWANKTPLEVLKDLHEILVDIWDDSLQVEVADTLLLPPQRWAYITTTPMSADNTTSIFEQFMRSNIYKAQTGKDLKVRMVRGLETAGVSGTARMIAYTRDPNVVRLHIPMVHRFLAAYQPGPLRYAVPGVFRFGGVDIRRPGAVRYRDGF